MTFSVFSKFLFLALIWLLPLSKTSAQDQFFKFKIKHEGIYKFSSGQLDEIGASSLSEVSFYGYPGSLPQKVDSSQLELQEIPSWQTEDGLFVYLSGPDIIDFDDERLVTFTNHLFSDSLSFLIGLNQNPKRIQEKNASPTYSGYTTLFRWDSFKEEKTNPLNSGRHWYSPPIKPGAMKSITPHAETKSPAPWKISGTLMGRSTDNSQMKLESSGKVVFETEVEAIPSTTYGIKGREVTFFTDFIPSGGKLSELNISFLSTASGSAGFFREILIGVPVESQDLKEGVYFSQHSESYQVSMLDTENILDISDFFNPQLISLQNGSTIASKKIIVFNPENCPEIPSLHPVSISLRKETIWPELLIISPALFSSEAEKLATHKLQMGIFSEVAYLNEIYDAFGYGNPDLNAIRNFIAWHFHKGGMLKNVLILGKGTFDYKGKLGGRPNLVPIYTSRNSLNPLMTFSSDDYFGLIDWGQGVWEESREGDETMQIGVGRLPVINSREAAIVVDKIIKYESSPAVGNWKKKITLMADDADNNIHLRDAEAHSAYLREIHGEYLQNKLYLDRFTQTPAGNGQISTEAKEALENTLQEGALLINYIGHGNESALTAEDFFRIEDINNWADQDKLALWVTATCEFGRHDSPFIRSAAEELLIAQNKGAIGLLTTGRPVFSSVNFYLNQTFIRQIFQTIENNYQDLGSIFKNTKNGSLNGPLNRNFSLLGDPSMKLANADYTIRLTQLSTAEGQRIDTLSALQEVWYEAEITIPHSGLTALDFSGTYELELLDKPQPERTLGDESNPVEFMEDKILLFKGTGKIDRGKIQGKLRIPSHIDYSSGKGRLRLYGVNTNGEEAFGVEMPIVEGISTENMNDHTGPDIKVMFEGNEKGPWVFPSKSLFTEISLADSSGINISGLGVGQDISVRVNKKESSILNNLFTATSNSYTRGKLSFQLEGLKEGINQISIQAFDLVGNETTVNFEIRVEGSNRIQILSHKVYPNPANKIANFEIRHNRYGENLLITLMVLNTEGQTLFVENQRLVQTEAVIGDLSWIFLQNQTKYPAKGTYIYKLTLRSEVDNSTAMASGKIVIQ